MEQMTAHPALAYLQSQKALPPLAEMALRVAVTVSIWEERRRTRLALKKIDPMLLDDIGLSRIDASVECDKPFWKA